MDVWQKSDRDAHYNSNRAMWVDESNILRRAGRKENLLQNMASERLFAGKQVGPSNNKGCGLYTQEHDIFSLAVAETAME